MMFSCAKTISNFESNRLQAKKIILFSHLSLSYPLKPLFELRKGKYLLAIEKFVNNSNKSYFPFIIYFNVTIHLLCAVMV